MWNINKPANYFAAAAKGFHAGLCWQLISCQASALEFIVLIIRSEQTLMYDLYNSFCMAELCYINPFFCRIYTRERISLPLPAPDCRFQLRIADVFTRYTVQTGNVMI